MLKRTKKDENNTPNSLAESVEEKPIAPASAPAVSQEKYVSEGKTTIGQGITIEGSIRGAENLVVEGAMKGTIEMGKHNFSIGPKGRVDGEIHAQDVSINGRFKGNIEALGKVAVTKEADFNGEIKAKSFSVEDGAYFKGVVELDREPHQTSITSDTTGSTSSPPSGKQSMTPPTGTKMEK